MKEESELNWKSQRISAHLADQHPQPSASAIFVSSAPADLDYTQINAQTHVFPC